MSNNIIKNHVPECPECGQNTNIDCENGGQEVICPCGLGWENEE